ncbi:MAG: cytochrome c [Gammaproteobacteria bacterium]|nr:cytochrome c [Gammaproteobacteria bacterium]
MRQPLSTLAALVTLVTAPLTLSAEESVSSARQAELRHLLLHDCGSCHGMRLEGGLGPSLKADRLAAWPTAALAATILAGRPGTPMPPWQPLLTAAEADWLALQLQQGVKQPQ